MAGETAIWELCFILYLLECSYCSLYLFFAMFACAVFIRNKVYIFIYNEIRTIVHIKTFEKDKSKYRKNIEQRLVYTQLVYTTIRSHPIGSTVPLYYFGAFKTSFFCEVTIS